MIKAQKVMSMESFVERILPFTEWAPYDVMKWANEALAEEKPFTLIVRDIEFTIPKESILAYSSKHGEDKTFSTDDPEDNAFMSAVENEEPPKRKPGRPRKATENDPIPEEFKG